MTELTLILKETKVLDTAFYSLLANGWLLLMYWNGMSERSTFFHENPKEKAVENWILIAHFTPPFPSKWSGSNEGSKRKLAIAVETMALRFCDGASGEPSSERGIITIKIIDSKRICHGVMEWSILSHEQKSSTWKTKQATTRIILQHIWYRRSICHQTFDHGRETIDQQASNMQHTHFLAHRSRWVRTTFHQVLFTLGIGG